MAQLGVVGCVCVCVCVSACVCVCLLSWLSWVWWCVCVCVCVCGFHGAAGYGGVGVCVCVCMAFMAQLGVVVCVCVCVWLSWVWWDVCVCVCMCAGVGQRHAFSPLVFVCAAPRWGPSLPFATKLTAALRSRRAVRGAFAEPEVLSLLAFVCEEVVSQCTLCGGLYFFEFVSCCAFLLSLLLLIVYCTPVYDRVDALKVKSSDFYITLGTGCVFLLASIIFVSTHDRTSAEYAAIVFGFMASFMFLFDFFAMLYEKRQESQLRKPENTARAETLTEPLNA
uniref:MARVEL domain-containing protein n=1 Tax=Oryctolagus cuniculus TaxID=9986 RepID=A0A5F9CS65_RABIT